MSRRYLVDNNALGFIGTRRRSSHFFRTRCRVTEDVAYEARFTVTPSVLGGLIEPVTATALTKLKEIMSTVPPGDTTLIDLYDNKGAADPMLVATALVLNEIESQWLDGDEWVIATRDKAVRTAAALNGINVATPEELARVIDDSLL